MIKDLALVLTKGGYYDISFDNGDFKLTEGLETAIWMSIFCEKRDPEIIDWQAQKGWVGDQLNDDGFQIGSLLWTLNQSKSDDETIIEAQSIIEDCLEWLLTQNYANEVIVSIYKNLAQTGLIANIDLIRNDNVKENLSFDLWNKTILT
jgi:phage gp46-like protein